MTSTAEDTDKDLKPTFRSRLARQMNCPILIVAGGRGIVDVSEAIKLQADCIAARIDLELAMPQIMRGFSGGNVENFVTSDDCIFRWLEQKLAQELPP
ncbi:hypothetical protein IVA80_29580 [Bradyrhizobium sp. 139]|nr:hypothetical protein [Bradyrhizobium sp. 139]